MRINVKNLKVRTNIPEGYEIVLPEEALKVFLHYFYDDVKRILEREDGRDEGYRKDI